MADGKQFIKLINQEFTDLAVQRLHQLSTQDLLDEIESMEQQSLFTPIQIEYKTDININSTWKSATLCIVNTKIMYGITI